MYNINGDFMAFDGLFLRHLLDLEKEKIKEARINSIGQIDNNYFVFSLWKNSAFNLIVSLEPGNCYFNIDNSKVNVNNEYSHFLNILKTHLLKGEILSISQANNDRIIEIKIKTINEINDEIIKYLYIELLGKFTNIILTKDDYTIIDAFKRISPNEKTNQIILPGFKYIFPSNPHKLDPYTEYNEEIKDNYIKNYYGISPLIEREIKYRENIQELINELKESDKIYIYKLDNKMEYHFIKLYQFNIEPEAYNYLEGIKKYYNDKLNYHIFKQRTNAISQVCNQQINKHKKTLAKLLNDLDTYKDNYLNKEYGDLLFTYIDLGYIENDYFIIDEEIKVPIDSSISISENAKKYFKIYSKNQKSIPYIKEYIEKSKHQIEYFENILDELTYSNDESLEQIKEELQSLGLFKLAKKSKKTKRKINLLTFTSKNGTLISVGRNNIQNEYLTFEYAKFYETFFHVKDYSGAHVVVHSQNLDEDTIRMAANLAAYYSKAKYSNSVPIDYTQVKNVKKHPANLPGKVLIKNYKTIYIDPIDPNKKN